MANCPIREPVLLLLCSCYIHIQRSWWFKQSDRFVISDYDVILSALGREYKPPCRELSVSTSFTSHEPHISVHFRLYFLHAQLIVMQIPLHPHLINCSTALGAGGSVVGTGCSLSPSCCHPCNIGLGMLGFGLSQDFQTNATRLARLVIWCRAALVGGSCSCTCYFLLKSRHRTSPMVLSCVDWMYNWHTKRSSVMYMLQVKFSFRLFFLI